MRGDPVTPVGLSDEQMKLWSRWNEAAVMASRIKHGYMGIPYPERTAVAAEFDKAAERYLETYAACLDQIECCPLSANDVDAVMGDKDWDWRSERPTAERIGLPTFSHRPHFYTWEGVTRRCPGEGWKPNPS